MLVADVDEASAEATGKMVAELVDHYVGSEGVVGDHRRKEVEDPAAAVLATIDNDDHRLIGGGGGRLA